MSYQNYSDDKEYKEPRKIKKSKKLKSLPPVDKNLFIVVLTLIIFGLVAVFSAGVPQGINDFDNPLYYPSKHLAFSFFGFFLMFLAARIPYNTWKKKNWLMWTCIIIIGLTAATLVPGLGRTSYGSSRWLTFLPIQPSEFCKFACILLISSALCNAKNVFEEKPMKHFMAVAALVLIIFLQPNMSMLILLAATTLFMLFVYGLPLFTSIGALIGGISAISIAIMHSDYQRSRIIGWLNPEADPQGMGYNIIQSWYAISSGGWFGVGLGASKQKLYYLPVGYTDFIFSVLAEEMGFVGISVLILLFLLFVCFGFKIAKRCEDPFGRLLAAGIVFNIGFQAFINMCVASGLFPVTGVTLPFVSYGGSSFIAICLMVGVLFNISRYAVKKERIAENDNEVKAKA